MSLIAVIADPHFAVDEGRSCFLRRTERMETEHLFRSAALLPVRLRLEGLHERLAHLDRTLAEVPTGLSDDIQRRLGRAPGTDITSWTGIRRRSSSECRRTALSRQRSS